MLITDLDGTLANNHRAISSSNRSGLIELGKNNILRVIATGRSLYSANLILEPDFPLDYLVFSSGAGIMAWPKRKILYSRQLDSRQAKRATRILLEENADFMLHGEIPDNHHFVFYGSGKNNPDFHRRLKLYRKVCKPGTGSPPPGSSCQLVVIIPTGQESFFSHLKKRLVGFKVVRSTSPLDHSSIWLEVFHPTVSKAKASAWIAARHGIDLGQSVAIGNDYNDLDLLDWATQPFVVANAPDQLRNSYPVVSSNDRDGVAEVIANCFNQRP